MRPPACRGLSNHASASCILVGREGYFDNVLKIRPPMVFKPDNADFLIAALDEAVAAI
jgi:4-aminobutyrate aminotransferase-like enzyme